METGETAKQQGKPDQLSNSLEHRLAIYKRTIDRILDECPRYDWEIVDYPNVCSSVNPSVIPEENQFYILLGWNGDKVIPCSFNLNHLEECTEEQWNEYIEYYIRHIKRIEKRWVDE